MLDRSATASGSAADRFNVFENLGAFVVSGSPALIRAVLGQPEVASAVANLRPAGDLLVRPVKRSPAGGARKKPAPR